MLQRLKLVPSHGPGGHVKPAEPPPTSPEEAITRVLATSKGNKAKPGVVVDSVSRTLGVREAEVRRAIGRLVNKGIVHFDRQALLVKGAPKTTAFGPHR